MLFGSEMWDQYNYKPMPRRSKNDVSKIRELLQTVCTECGYSIAPIDLVRLDNERGTSRHHFAPAPKG
jgi:hypothetical protein